MKRFHYIMLSVLALSSAVAIGFYSDSKVKKAETVQVIDLGSYDISGPVVAVFTAELPVPMIIDAPYLGRPASNPIMVSEELASGFKMSARPPPEYKGQKSVYNTDKEKPLSLGVFLFKSHSVENTIVE